MGQVDHSRKDPREYLILVPIHGHRVFWWYSGGGSSKGKEEQMRKVENQEKCEVPEAIGVWGRGVWRETSALSDVALKVERPPQLTLRTIPTA